MSGEEPMTKESLYLRALAERVAAAYLAQTAPRAVLLTGSAADGRIDRYSDLDLILCGRAIAPYVQPEVLPNGQRARSCARAAGRARTTGFPAPASRS